MLFDALLTLMPGEGLIEETNILILGVDGVGYVNRSDTIMVARISPQSQKVSIVSIPRDARVEIQGHGEDKITHAYAFGGIELSKSTVENFLGIKIPYYIVIDMAGLRNLIDELGGVTIDVEKKMYYVDSSQGLFVNLNPGRQRLSGKDALSYLRYRKDGGDLTRIGRQQRFIKAFADQISLSGNTLRSPQIVFKLLGYMHSNLNTRQVIGLAVNLRKIYDYGSIRMTSIQGGDNMVNGVYYMRPDMARVKEVVNSYLKTDIISKEVINDKKESIDRRIINSNN